MDDEERRSAKRSRFDQTEPRERHANNEEGKRQSRFDRKSRIPSSKDLESRRSRSPARRDTLSPTSEGEKKAALDPAAAAGLSA